MKSHTIASAETRTAEPAVNTHQRQQSRLSELLADRQSSLPVWVRAPRGGPEHFTGLSRSKLYDLSSKGLIRSVSVRENGRTTGVRLFQLQSILAYIETAAALAEE